MVYNAGGIYGDFQKSGQRLSSENYASFYYKGTLTRFGLAKLKLLIFNQMPKLKAYKNINLFINSNGGEVNPTLDFIRFMQLYRADGWKFNIVVEEFCASACFPLLQSADLRAIKPNAVLMIHRSFLYFPFDIKLYTDYTEQLDELMLYIECGRITLPDCYDILKELKKQDYYFYDSQLMLDFDLIDKVLE